MSPQLLSRPSFHGNHHMQKFHSPFSAQDPYASLNRSLLNLKLQLFGKVTKAVLCYSCCYAALPAAALSLRLIVYRILGYMGTAWILKRHLNRFHYIHCNLSLCFKHYEKVWRERINVATVPVHSRVKIQKTSNQPWIHRILCFTAIVNSLCLKVFITRDWQSSRQTIKGKQLQADTY